MNSTVTPSLAKLAQDIHKLADAILRHGLTEYFRNECAAIGFEVSGAMFPLPHYVDGRWIRQEWENGGPVVHIPLERTEENEAHPLVYEELRTVWRRLDSIFRGGPKPGAEIINNLRDDADRLAQLSGEAEPPEVKIVAAEPIPTIDEPKSADRLEPMVV